MMEGKFRFILDDFVEVFDQPIGWEDAEIVIKRNDREYGGLFVTYLPDLKFWGDGFAYLNQQISNLGYCFSCKLNITYECGSDIEEVFTGYINAANAETDHEKCLISVTIEPDDIYASFLKNSSTAYSMQYASVPFLDGNAVTSPYQIIQYHKVDTGDNTTTPFNVASAFSAIDGLDYLARMSSRNQLRVESNFFTNQTPVTETWEIVFSGASLQSGDIITVTYKNYFGITASFAVPFSIDENTTIVNIGNRLIAQVNSGTALPIFAVERYFDLGAFANNGFDLLARTILLESWLPVEIQNVEITGSGPLATVSFTKTRDYAPGGADLYLAPQVNETASSYIWATQYNVDAPLSFRDLFLELDKIYCLGMQLIIEPNDIYLRIEPMEYFFSQPTLLRLDDIENMKTRFESERAYNLVQLDSGKNFGSASSQIGGNGPFTITSGSAIMAGPTGTLQVNQYITANTTGEVFRIKTIISSISLEVYDPAITSTTATVFVVQYNLDNVGPCLVNEPMTAYAAPTCLGDTLDLSNKFVTDIERHGDQTTVSIIPNDRNFSAGSDPKLFCFLQCNPGSFLTKSYRYMINDNGAISERFAFNGHMTNHHKIINNYIRIKQNIYANGKFGTQFSGDLYSYRNNSEIKPDKITEFDYFLSFSDMQTMINNPSCAIEIDKEQDGTYEKAWIYEIRMKLNIKKVTFALYS